MVFIFKVKEGLDFEGVDATSSLLSEENHVLRNTTYSNLFQMILFLVLQSDLVTLCWPVDSLYILVQKIRSWHYFGVSSTKIDLSS
jgi:hypothetical protein